MSTNFFRLICLFALLLLHSLSAKVIYVDDNATAGGTGTSWATAHKYLQDALAVAVDGDELRVAEGIYKPDQGAGKTAGDREASFMISKNITLIGGFLGNETTPTPLGKPDYTLMSGEINEDHTYWSLNTLVVGNTSGKISNFSIKHGNNNASGNWNVTGMSGGGGLLFKGKEFEISKCIFSENPSRMYIEGDSTNLFSNCVFSNTVAVKGDVEFLNCVFTSKSNFISAGRVLSQTHKLLYDGQITFRNCTILSNIQQSWGDSRLIMINSIFGVVQYNGIKEKPRVDGEILGPFTNKITILPRIAERYPGDPNSREGILYAPNATTGFDNMSGYDSYIKYDYLHHWPIFLNRHDPIGKDNMWFTNDDGLRLVENSSVLNKGSTPHLFNSYDQYTSFVNSGSIGLTDIMGKNRVNGSSVDIGAYEYYFVPQYNVSEVNSSAGTINGGGQYYADTEATLQADPTAGYSFLKWEGDLDSSINPIKVPVTKNLSVSAKFVSTAIINLAKGATNPSPNWFSNSWFGTFFTSDSTWIYHSVLGWLYVHPVDDLSYWMWSSEYGWLWFHKEHFPFLYSNKYSTWLWLSRSSSDLFIFGDSTKTWNYYFDSVKTISVSLEPEGAGVVTGVGEYSKGSSVSLNANADNYHQFMYWKKDNQVVSQNADYSFVVDENVNLVAVFEGQGDQEVDYATVTLGVFPLNSGGVFIKDSQSSWVEKSTSFNFPVGEILSIKPNIAGYNHYFQSWSLPDGSVSTNETITVDVDSNLTLGLNLLNSFKLSLSSTGVTASHFTLLDGSDVPLFFEDMASPNISYWRQGANAQVKTFAGGYKSDELPYPWERWQGFRNTFTLGIQMNEDLEIVAAWPE